MMIQRAPFGATGHQSSRVIFGAAALGDVSQNDADRTLDVLLEHGVDHIDVAASYGDAGPGSRPCRCRRCTAAASSGSPSTPCPRRTTNAFLLTTGDVEILPRLLDAAERFEHRPDDGQMAELASRAQAEPLFV